LADTKKLEFMRTLIGSPVKAITLNRLRNCPAGEFTEALTDNFLKLLVPGRQQPNHWVMAHVEQVTDEALVSRAY
jgi:hypothetical protein